MTDWTRVFFWTWMGLFAFLGLSLSAWLQFRKPTWARAIDESFFLSKLYFAAGGLSVVVVSLIAALLITILRRQMGW